MYVVGIVKSHVPQEQRRKAMVSAPGVDCADRINHRSYGANIWTAGYYYVADHVRPK